ncbi:hypothetical protein [Dulcicalothrix desertica]|nr:hypothetical protein [Dulcicalothrix desertica]
MNYRRKKHRRHDSTFAQKVKKLLSLKSFLLSQAAQTSQSQR